MKSTLRKSMPVFVVGMLLAGMLACVSTPVSQKATATAPVPPTIELTEPSTVIPVEALTPTFTPIPVFTVVSLVSNPTEETGKSPDFTIKAQTPFFQGSEDLRVTNLNNEMTQLTQEDNVAQVQPMTGSAGSFYDQQYQLLSPPGNLVSLRFKIMIYIQGAAHPGSHMRTVTYDLEAGSDVKLVQLFLSDTNYLERLANYCIAQLLTRDIGFDSTSSGARPLPENYGNWNITANGLLITFDEYQVAAYAAGPQEVVVPYAELQPVIDPHGPLAGFLP
jgi:hypothetical protein